MQNKKFAKVLALSVLGLFALTGCDEVVATPTNYEEKLVETGSFSEEIHNNIASVVYDSIHGNGIGGDVLNQILYLYAVDAYGPYNGNVVVNTKKAKDVEGTITLEQAYNAAKSGDDATVLAFVKVHWGYWDGETRDADSALKESEKQRVITKYESIKDERIPEAMYEKISTGTFTDRHIYSERLFLKSLKNELKSVTDPNTLTDDQLYRDQILPATEPKDVFTGGKEGKPYLHRDYYESDTNTYVVDEVVPTIYRQLLTEKYVVDETYNTLGRSYARKVNIIKFNYNENYPSTAYTLANSLVREINNGTSYDTSLIGTKGILARFKDYSDAQVGNYATLTDDEKTIFDDQHANIEAFDVNNYPAAVKEELKLDLGAYYPGTGYGDLAEKYTKMRDVEANGVNTESENTFSNNGAYPFYVGLQQEKLSLNENDYTTTGWFIKNGGLSDLPEAIRTRLFNIGVATGVKETTDERKAYERTYDKVKEVWNEPVDKDGKSIENAYVCRINGHNYLKTASRVKGDPIDNDILHYDSSSKCYYIIEIEEAVSSSKLSLNGSHNYEKTRDAEAMQDITDEVAKIVGQSESYSTLAIKKYLRAMDITYHDESVYDYFKTNYPELFDEDAEESSDDSGDSSDSSSSESSSSSTSSSSEAE